MSDKEKQYSREREGVVTAAAGLALNLLLGSVKLVFGFITGSMSVMSDAVNNLSDVGTSTVTFSTFALAGKKADREHPYGHGRYEYIATLLVSLLIIVVGAELVVSSVKSIINVQKAQYSLVALVVLLISVAVKFFMGVMYTVRNKKVKSDTLKAASFDSFSDCVVTSLVALAFGFSAVTDFPVDAVCGIAAAVFIVFGGLRMVLDTVNKLLGSGYDKEVENKILELVKSYPQVKGVHDLMVHDYGPEHKVASVDAEFEMSMSFSEVHSIVDEIERTAYVKYKINLVVHSDPVDTSDPEFAAVRHAVIAALEPYGREASFHDLELRKELRQASIHLQLTKELMKEKEHILSEVIEAVNSVCDGYTVDAEYDFG